ncbi:YncE family protein [Lihuaxuella thermophila]|nr:hypothetical protein [Lihuaxuella thermophila]
MRKRSLLFIILFSISALIIGCNNNQPLIKNISDSHIAVIYTDATKEDSELVFIDDKKQILGSHQMKQMYIKRIERGENNELLLPVAFGDSIITIQADGKISERETPIMPLDIFVHKGVEISSYNTDYSTGTLEKKQEDQVKKTTLSGLLEAVAMDDDYVYAVGNAISDKYNALYILEKDTLKVHKEIGLGPQYGIGKEIQILDGKLLLTSPQTKSLTIVTKGTREMKQVKLPYKEPDDLLIDQDSIYVTYMLGNHITKIDRKTLQVKGSFSTGDQAVLRADMDSQNIYVLSQAQNDPQPRQDIVGRIGIYNKQTGNKVGMIELPNKRNMGVQDLIITNPSNP